MGRYSTRASLHIPSLADLLAKHEMGGQTWRGQFPEEFPTLGILAEIGVYPAHTGAATPTSREELLKGTKERVKFDERRRDDHAIQLWGAARVQVGKGGSDDPYPFTGSGKLLVKCKKLVAHPA